MWRWGCCKASGQICLVNPWEGGESVTFTCLRAGVVREGEAPAEPLPRLIAAPGSRLSRSFALPNNASIRLSDI